MRTLKTGKWSPSLHGVLLILLVVMLVPTTSWAVTAANTLIRNQASATFKDETGTSYAVTSNVVETLVQQVAGLELTQSQTKLASANGTVDFPHVITNTGNGDDRFNLTTTQSTGDDFDFSQVTYYADLNQDGQADDVGSPITQTPILAAGESFAFIAVVNVPNTVVNGNDASLTLTATSQFTPTTNDVNTDTAQVTNNAIVEVTKAMSADSGTAGSGNYTITLSYRNTSSVDSTNLVLIDALPTGMDYIAGSARWSHSGNTVLTDANPADAQGSGPTVVYCAYDPSCIGLPEANKDADSDPSNQVTATISNIAAGASGQLTFEVSIGAAVLPATLTNIAEYEFYDSAATTNRFDTNTVKFKVIATPDVVTNGSSTVSTDGTDEPITLASVPQNGTATFQNYVWNTGNSTDSFDLSFAGSTFPSGTVLQLLHSDGSTPLLDTNGNGTPDTGPLDPNENHLVVIKAQLPPSAVGDNGGLGYEVNLVATSFEDSSLSNSALNRLNDILPNLVDLTNHAAIGQPGVTGQGPGPEAAPVTTNAILPGTSTQFVLYVNNTGPVADNFDLQASTDSTFASITLPANWTVKFLDENNAPLTNTGNIATNTSKKILLDVSVPANAGNNTVSLYFRVLSPVTGVSDIKHDAVTVGEVTDLVLYPDNTGQVLPGGIVLYSHTLENQGNTDKVDINFTNVNDKADWQTVLYIDTDANGVLSAADQPLTNIPSLVVGESVLIFNKVMAAATIPMGQVNTTTITASWDAGLSTTHAIDVTTTNNSDLTIRKEQALDADCNGVADGAFSTANFPAEPQQCVMYRLTATNNGVVQVHNVKIQDATPAYTVFSTNGGLPSLTKGSLLAPITHGGRGNIIGVVGDLDAGDNAALLFAIKVQ